MKRKSIEMKGEVERGKKGEGREVGRENVSPHYVSVLRYYFTN